MELKSSDTDPAVQPAAGRRRWTLNRSALQGLLSSLDADEQRAALQYEQLRQRLIIFFSGRRCIDPEERADDTLDRISRRIDEGEQIRDVTRFAYGVARLVLSESFKRVRRRDRLLTWLAGSDDSARPNDAAEAPGTDDSVDCIRRCASHLKPEDRDLIFRYYESAGREQQEERKQLAARLDVSPVALRLRAHRIRRVLETCTRDCLAGPAAGRT
jgi:DNA-directed RNA polymerase specialized sigma24 family protein